MKRATAWADGGIRGNPNGPSACAVVIDVENEASRQYSRYLGLDGSNNTAEYHGLLLALREAAEIDVTHLAVRLDSKLVVEQVLGNWRAKDPKLAEMRDQARTLARRYFVEVQIDYISREENVVADALCTKILDDITSRPRGLSRAKSVC